MYKQRVTIIGNYLSFRKLLFDAVNEKLEERIPFLHNPVISLHNFHEDFTLDDQELLNEMFSAIGLHIVQEPMLTQHIKELPQTDVDDDYTVAADVFFSHRCTARGLPEVDGSCSNPT